MSEKILPHRKSNVNALTSFLAWNNALKRLLVGYTPNPAKDAFLGLICYQMDSWLDRVRQDLEPDMARLRALIGEAQ